MIKDGANCLQTKRHVSIAMPSIRCWQHDQPPGRVTRFVNSMLGLVRTPHGTQAPTPMDRLDSKCLFGFAIAFAIVQVFFVFDAMDFWGVGAFYVMGAGLLLTFGIRLWIAVELIVRLIQFVTRRRKTTQLISTLGVALLAWSPPVILGAFPLLPHYSFLWRHEDGFMRAIHSRAQREGVEHYEHGAAFEFSWYTITDCCYVVIYEPDRPAGSQPLSRDTNRFYPQKLDFDLHLRGPWYAVLY